MKHLQTIYIPKFPYRILIANSRKPKYKNGRCTNKNLLSKPRYKKINTQQMYSGFNSHHERKTVVDGIKAHFQPRIEAQSQEITGPVHIKLRLYDVPGDWDLDNKSWLYFKCFQDCLHKVGVIRDDNIYNITGNSYEFVPVDDQEDRAMNFEFYQDTRKELTHKKKRK